MTVQSIEVMPGDDSSDDVLWLTVLRSGSMQVEKLDMTSPDTMDDAVYVDCARTIEYGTPTDTISVPHLAGQNVDALADNAVLPIKTLDGFRLMHLRPGPSAASPSGYPIEARIRLLRPELPANGTSQGKRQIQEQTLRLYRSLGGKVVTNGRESPASFTRSRHVQDG